MKDLIEFVAARLAEYLPLLFRIVAHPRINIPTLVRQDGAFASAAVFAGVTLAITLGLQAPLMAASQDILLVSLATMISAAIEFCAVAAALILVFRLFGGKARFEDTLVATVYIVCPLALMMMILALVANGALSAYDPALAEEWRRSDALSDATLEAMFRIDRGMAVFLWAASVAGLLAATAWLVASWPVYGRLNGFSRLRSAASFVLGIAAAWGVAQIGSIISSGLFPDGTGAAF